MALALGRTANQPLEWTDVGLGGALLCWGISFYYGCRHIQSTQMLLRLNMRLESGQVEIPLGVSPVTFRKAVSELADEHGTDAGAHARKQFRFLLGGAALYVAWHIIGMAACTPSLDIPLKPNTQCAVPTPAPAPAMSH